MSDTASPALTTAEALRQMLAVLETERQALAGLDIDQLIEASTCKQSLCDVLAPVTPEAIDAECNGLLQSARQMNEVNRRVRNLLAANVAARLEALTGSPGSYQAAIRQTA